MKCFFNISLVTVTLLVIVFSSDALDIKQLLPNGGLMQSFNKLNTLTKVKVIDRLKDIPHQDEQHLRAHSTGELYYVDDMPDVNKIAEFPPLDESSHKRYIQEGQGTAPFNLHSRPGATNVLFLNFQGETVSGTAWNSSTFTVKPYTLDDVTSSFSPAEISAITTIWQNVAEDYAPWNIDVTTERPTTFTTTTGHIVVTLGEPGLPSWNTSGGISYVGVFGAFNYYLYRPGFCYYNNLGSSTKAIAECCSHEFGHNLGLSHDGSSTSAYYMGLGSGNVGWAPIMGAGYYKPVTQWSKGEYPDANNKQDDIAIITKALGSALASTPSSSVQTTSASCSTLWTVNGLINSATGSNSWSFTLPATASSVTITLTPNLAATGADLDAKFVLQNSAGTVLSTVAPTGSTSATYTSSLAKGTYTVVVRGDGDTTTPYSNYASFGTYTMTICAKAVSKKRVF